MDLDGIMLSEISQKMANTVFTSMWNLHKKHMISLICRLLKKYYKRTYLQNRNRVTDVENKLMVTNKGESGGGVNWEIGINIYTTIYKTGN